ncbi:MAG: sigma-70 family RNA polymerase sigma factor [Archangiaceae bacterium]|nr:sigma-70 family RNA polymerase sigma factor [Archangiaceae bacterium]
MARDDARAVALALGGDVVALGELTAELLPVIQGRVARALLRRAPRASGRSPRQEIEDLSHDVMLSLLADRGRVLRSWSAARGLSLHGFVGFVADREVASIMRVARRNPWTEDPTLDEHLDRSDEGNFELRIESQQLLERLLDRVTERLSPLGLKLFELLFISQRPVPEICAETGMQRDAVYAWRSRLGRLARELCAELTAEAPLTETVP